MIFNHKNISGTAVQTLTSAVADSTSLYTIERLIISNTDSTAITVSIYLDDSSDQFYLIKGTTIPVGASLDFLDGIPFKYKASYALKLVLGDAAYTADVIFNQY